MTREIKQTIVNLSKDLINKSLSELESSIDSISLENTNTINAAENLAEQTFEKIRTELNKIRTILN